MKLLAALLLIAAVSAGAQPAPYRRWQTLETSHFRVHTPAGLEREGRVAAAAAERAWDRLAQRLHPPRTPIELVVTDDADYSNGSATPFPSNRIVVITTPPIEDDGLRMTADWVEMVVTHELAHVFHLDRARGVWGGLQRVFGRMPLLFPNVFAPSWFTEGLAVYYESTLTEGGRLRGQAFRSVVDASAIDGALPRLGDLSLSTPRFPGGEGAYGYGALFVQHLAATHGDSALRQFVERQSGTLLPFLDHSAARRAFGQRFDAGFSAWRDSVRASVRDADRAPRDDWRALASGLRAVPSPRWVNDTTIVYTGTDGRSSNAAWTVTTGGVRTRLGRRSSQGANVPLRGGGLLFAQLEYDGPDQIRSDLYIERDGEVTRLTRGARLTQPDATGDRRIVAVELASNRSSLVLLDSLGGSRRVLREAGPGETWSEPRWAPGGRRIAAVRRMHGGDFRLEIIDAPSGDGCVLASSRAVIASPSFATESSIMYMTERSGHPHLELVTGCGRGSQPATTLGPSTVAAEVSWRVQWVAAVQPRGSGYELGVAPTTGWRGVGSEAGLVAQVAPPADPQPLAAGEYAAYRPWRTLAPRWWLPVIEDTPDNGVRLGALTSGSDAVGRHAYDAWFALQPGGSYSTGALAYRYAGFRRPIVDASLSHDWTTQAFLIDGAGARIGNLLKRTQDLSLAATWVRPRARSYASLTAGLAVERRRFATEPGPLLATLDTSLARGYTYPRAFVSAGWSNAQRPILSISPEDGVALAVTARERYRTDDASRTRTRTVVGTASGYRSLDLPGFAHHVLALRLAGGVADARASSALEVGGTSGAIVDVAPGATVGEGRQTFPVRGFPGASMYGTRAVAASLEYRAPLALIGRGSHRIPAFLDRASAHAFIDAASAGCSDRPLYAGICSPAPAIGRVIGSTGLEVAAGVALLQVDAPLLARLGVAVPVAGRAAIEATGVKVQPVSVYVAFGLGF